MVSLLLSLREIVIRIKRIPGAVFFLEPIRKSFLNINQQITITNFDVDLRLNVDLSDHMGSNIFWFGSYSRDILLLLHRILSPGDVVFDVGANIGEITTVAAKLVGAYGTVIAIEPVTKIAEKLQGNSDINGFNNVRVIRKAATNKVGWATIFTEEDVFNDGYSHSGLGTIYPSATRNKEIEQTETTTLDSLVIDISLKKVDGIKIDAEGAELSVLLGSQKLLTDFHPWLIVELNQDVSSKAGYLNKDIIDYLATYGYKAWKIGRKGKITSIGDGEVQGFQNLLFLHHQNSPLNTIYSDSKKDHAIGVL